MNTQDALDLLNQPGKPWWQSTTILGAAAAVLSQAVALAGYQLDASQTLGILTDLVGLAGGALAIVGRVRAVRPIVR